MKLWEILNGRKTAIGAGMLFVAGAMSKLNIESLVGIIEALEYVGMSFSAGGLCHKAIKSR